jgi:hypothetical protein
VLTHSLLGRAPFTSHVGLSSIDCFLSVNVNLLLVQLLLLDLLSLLLLELLLLLHLLLLLDDAKYATDKTTRIRVVVLCLGGARKRKNGRCQEQKSVCLILSTDPIANHDHSSTIKPCDGEVPEQPYTPTSADVVDLDQEH